MITNYTSWGGQGEKEQARTRASEREIEQEKESAPVLA